MEYITDRYVAHGALNTIGNLAFLALFSLLVYNGVSEALNPIDQSGIPSCSADANLSVC